MTNSPSITLAGGIKAPRRRFSSGEAAPGAFSPAHAAFIALIEALADAVEAEGLRVSGAAWDMAYVAPEVRAQIALNDVVGAARQAGDAPVVIASLSRRRSTSLRARIVRTSSISCPPTSRFGAMPHRALSPAAWMP
jgi:hypothetical protein